MTGLAELLEVEAPELTAGDRFCHFLDGEGRALCFADVSGRTIHNTGDKIGSASFAVSFSGNASPYCDGCGRPRCPKCAEIDAALRGLAA